REGGRRLTDGPGDRLLLVPGREDQGEAVTVGMMAPDCHRLVNPRRHTPPPPPFPRPRETERSGVSPGMRNPSRRLTDPTTGAFWVVSGPQRSSLLLCRSTRPARASVALPSLIAA